MGLANYRGSALTTGCSTGGSCGVRTELMNLNTMSWQDEDDFPYTQWVFYRTLMLVTIYFVINICHQHRQSHHHYFRVFFDYIYEYSTASTSDAAYIIGGAPRYMETIARFKNYQWSNHGKLYRGRMVHGSISVGDNTFIIGGETDGLK